MRCTLLLAVFVWFVILRLGIIFWSQPKSFSHSIFIWYLLRPPIWPRCKYVLSNPPNLFHIVCIGCTSLGRSVNVNKIQINKLSILLFLFFNLSLSFFLSWISLQQYVFTPIPLSFIFVYFPCFSSSVIFVSTLSVVVFQCILHYSWSTSDRVGIPVGPPSS